MRVATSLVPEPARTVPGKRALGVAFRTAHIASFGVLLGGTLFAVEPARRVLRISSIFDWFAGDFEARGGVRRFVAAYAPEAQRAWLEGEGRDASIQYLEYDWSVNALAGAAGGG